MNTVKTTEFHKVVKTETGAFAVTHRDGRPMGPEFETFDAAHRFARKLDHLDGDPNGARG